MHRRLPLLVVLIMIVSLALSACGDATNTPAAPTTAATTTTSAATTTAAVTAATTTAAVTAATTTAAVTANNTPAASSDSDPFALSPIQPLPAGKQGGTFTHISMSDLAPEIGIYPSAGGFTNSWLEISNLIWAGSLASYNYTTLKWELDSAKALKVSSDKKTFTWTLRDDLKWSDGKPITVEDYKAGYDGAIKEDKANADNNFVGLDDFKRITKVEIDPTAKTVTLTLDDVYAPDLALGYVTSLLPVPRQVYGDKPFFEASKNPEITKPTVTSGPYMIESWDAKSQGVVVRNPNYYRGSANFDKQVLKPGSPAVVLQALKSNQADWAVNIPPAQYAQAKADPTLKMYDWTAVNGSFRYIEYNTKKAPLDDKTFRQALNYAIDKASLIKLAEVGLGTPSNSFLTADNNYYNKDLSPYAYNLDNAKKMIAQAGYKTDGSGNLLDKSGKAIELTVVFPTSSNPRKLIATYLQQQLKQLGIKINVDGKEFQAYTKQIKAHDFDISLSTAGGGFPDPDNFKSNIITDGQQNNTQYSNPTLDKLFEQGNRETDPAKRKEIYNQVQKIIGDDSPVFFLYTLTNYSPMNTKVQGVTPSKEVNLWTNDATMRWTLSDQ